MAAGHIRAIEAAGMVAIIAHGGARSLAPENTLAAARKAYSLGADLWEADAAITADGQVVLMHDDAMTRTTDVAAKFADRVPAPFSTHRLADIQALDSGSWFEREEPFGQVAAGAVTAAELASYHGEKIPTLREAFEPTLRLDWRMNLELKTQPKPNDTVDVVGAVLALADDAGIGPDHLLFSSARHERLKALRAGRPEFEVQAILGLFPEDTIDVSDAFFGTFNVRITRVAVDELCEVLTRGIKVNTYTPNEAGEIAELMALGVTGIITDFSQRGARR